MFFFLGLFGLAAYAYSIAGIAAGVLILLKIPMKQPLHKVFSAAGMYFFAAMALHLISSAAHLPIGTSFNTYMSACWQSNVTVGGLSLGLFVYPVASLIGRAASYVLFALFFGACALGMSKFSLLKPKNEPSPQKRESVSAFTKNGSTGQKVNRVDGSEVFKTFEIKGGEDKRISEQPVSDSHAKKSKDNVLLKTHLQERGEDNRSAPVRGPKPVLYPDDPPVKNKNTYGIDPFQKDYSKETFRPHTVMDTTRVNSEKLVTPPDIRPRQPFPMNYDAPAPSAPIQPQTTASPSPVTLHEIRPRQTEQDSQPEQTRGREILNGEKESEEIVKERKATAGENDSSEAVREAKNPTGIKAVRAVPEIKPFKERFRNGDAESEEIRTGSAPAAPAEKNNYFDGLTQKSASDAVRQPVQKQRFVCGLTGEESFVETEAERKEREAQELRAKKERELSERQAAMEKELRERQATLERKEREQEERRLAFEQRAQAENNNRTAKPYQPANPYQSANPYSGQDTVETTRAGFGEFGESAGSETLNPVQGMGFSHTQPHKPETLPQMGFNTSEGYEEEPYQPDGHVSPLTESDDGNYDSAVLFTKKVNEIERGDEDNFKPSAEGGHMPPTEKNYVPITKETIKQANDAMNNSILKNQKTIFESPEDEQTSAPPPAPKKKKKKGNYTFPATDMLDMGSPFKGEIDDATRENARILETTLKQFNAPATVKNIIKGPAVTRYEVQMQQGVPVKEVEKREKDIKYYLAATGEVRIEAPIPGKQAVGIEVPNAVTETVTLREIIDSKEFQKASDPLTFAIGKNIAGDVITCSLVKMPHLLIAGSTGSGKSCCLNSLITSLLYKHTPEELKFLLIDPKRVEFPHYAGLPHMLLEKPITEPEEAIQSLVWIQNESERRYKLFEQNRVREMKEYNAKINPDEEEILPYIVIIIDEAADLMHKPNDKKQIEQAVRYLSAKARAAGIHLVLATQRPSVDVITGTIKANLPSRIAFSVTNGHDSKTILDQPGAENLLGKGDMLYSPNNVAPVRVQGAFISGLEVEAVVSSVKQHNESDFDTSIYDSIYSVRENAQKDAASEDLSPEDKQDPLLLRVLKFFIKNQKASVSLIQRKFSVGWNRAAGIVDQLEALGYIGGQVDGTNKPRAVYITMEEFEEKFGYVED
jgi:DNA segregation ATPase FtsK/SpoIIIE-like protein